MARWLRSISLLSLLIALLVFTDYFLPLRENKYVVKERTVRTGFEELHYEIFQKIPATTGDEEFWLILDQDEVAVSENDLKKQMPGDTILVFKTVIFGLNAKMKNTKSSEDFFYPYLSAYGYLLIFPFAFLIIFALNIIFPRKNELIISLGVINIILLVGFGMLLLFY